MSCLWRSTLPPPWMGIVCRLSYLWPLLRWARILLRTYCPMAEPLGHLPVPITNPQWDHAIKGNVLVVHDLCIRTPPLICTWSFSPSSAERLMFFCFVSLSVLSSSWVINSLCAVSLEIVKKGSLVSRGYVKPKLLLHIINCVLVKMMEERVEMILCSWDSPFSWLYQLIQYSTS